MLIIPQILISPLIVTVVGFSYFKYDQRYKQYIIRHMSAVGTLALSWLPAGILHLWNGEDIGHPPDAMKNVHCTVDSVDHWGDVRLPDDPRDAADPTSSAQAPREEATAR